MYVCWGMCLHYTCTRVEKITVGYHFLLSASFMDLFHHLAIQLVKEKL